MPRKYSVEFKEKAVHQIIEMVRLESCSLQRAYEQVGELLGVSRHTLRAWYREMVAQRRIAKQWKKNSSVCAERTVN